MRALYIYICIYVYIQIPFKGLYRALIPSFPTKNQPDPKVMTIRAFLARELRGAMAAEFRYFSGPKGLFAACVEYGLSYLTLNPKYGIQKF